LFFGLFCETKKQFFGFVSVFRTGIETTETNRTLLKQTETNRKNLQKTFSIRVSLKQFFFFLGLNQNKLNPNLSRLFLGLFFARNQKFFFSVCFGVSYWYQNNQNKQNLWYGELKMVDILTNLLLFWLVFCLFLLFGNTETPCFDIKPKQPKETSCFGKWQN
jgi:hypothetical protein